MPKSKTKTIYCIAPARNGKGGTFKVGEKLADLDEEKAAHLLSSKRFTEDEKEAKAAVAALADVEKTKEADASKDEEIAKLKKELAEAKKASK